ncbi:MAG: pilus assembly protein TadG-related protein [Actinomycetota bacterium]|nr:pilus assembly protein TadG-related protein [Actinomycetota bacterium]
MKTSCDEGQTTILVVGLALLVFSITGFAIDGTRAFLMRRTLQNAADGAALAGASELHLPTYYSSAGRIVELDPDEARTEALRLLGHRALPAEAQITASRTRIHVVLSTEVDTTFLAGIGIGSLPVMVGSRAEPLPVP